MSAVGTWNLEISTPMGSQSPTLTITSGDDGLAGTLASPMGTLDLEDIKEDGNNVTFAAAVDGPGGQMEITFSATIDGDEISGEVELGPMGKSAFTGKRA